MNRKEKYESPWMERTLVELEDGFCAGSAVVKNPNDDYGRIDNQTINTGFDLNTDNDTDGYADGGWLK